jgi:hypothetical protein
MKNLQVLNKNPGSSLQVSTTAIMAWHTPKGHFSRLAGKNAEPFESDYPDHTMYTVPGMRKLFFIFAQPRDGTPG